MGEHEKRHNGSGGAGMLLGFMLVFVLLAGWVAWDGMSRQYAGVDQRPTTNDQGQTGPGLGAVIADARATVGAAQGMMQETARAKVERERKATLQAAQTQGAVRAELDLLEGRLEATRVAMELGFTVAEATEVARVRGSEAAGTAEARRTQAAGTATQQAGLTQAAVPTVTAMAFTAAKEYREMKYQAWVDVFWLFFWPVLAVVILVTLVAVVFMQGLRFLDWVVKWLNLRHSVRVPDGRLVWDVKGELPSVVTSLRALPFARGDGDDVRQLTPSGSVLASPMLPRRSMAGRQRRDLLVFLETAVRVAGEGSKVIPGWRSMPGFSSSAWQEMIGVLAEAGLVQPRLGVATYVGEGIEDLGDLLERVEVGTPTPPRLDELNEV